jgi:hypothetical protein
MARGQILLLFLVTLFLVSSQAWAQPALSFSGGGTWTWSGATIGWEFSIASPITVSALGVWEDGDGMSDSHDVGIWTSPGGSLIVSTTVTSANPLTNGFRYASITPTVLPAGSYVVGSYMPTSADLGAADASYATVSQVNYVQNLYLYGSGFTIPTTHWATYDGGNFGANFIIGQQVPTTPEWGIVVLAVLLAGLGFWYLRRRRFKTS